MAHILQHNVGKNESALTRLLGTAKIEEPPKFQGTTIFHGPRAGPPQPRSGDGMEDPRLGPKREIGQGGGGGRRERADA